MDKQVTDVGSRVVPNECGQAIADSEASRPKFILGVPTVEPFGRRQAFVLSYEEKEAIIAAAQNKCDDAKKWFDRAIIADPERGPRIDQTCVYMQAPLEVRRVYLGFHHAVHAQDAQVYREHLESVFRRCPELSVSKEEALTNVARYLTPGQAKKTL
jgi:hypothetical protein